MNTIGDWLRVRKADKQHRLYDRGYDWAAGEVLRKHGDTSSAEARIEAIGMFDYGTFEKGALDAIRAFDRLWEQRHAA